MSTVNTGITGYLNYPSSAGSTGSTFSTMTATDLSDVNQSVDALEQDFEQTYGFTPNSAQLMYFANQLTNVSGVSIFSVWNSLATGDTCNPNEDVHYADYYTSDPAISTSRSYSDGSESLLFQDSSGNVLGFNLASSTAYLMSAEQFTNIIVPASLTSSGESIFPTYMATIYNNQIGISYVGSTTATNPLFDYSDYYDQLPKQLDEVDYSAYF